MPKDTISQEAQELQDACDKEIVVCNGETFTVKQLREAFDKIAPKPNWKKEISFTFLGSIQEINLFNAAIPFYVGGINKIEVLGCGLDKERLMVRISNKGYYHNIGA